MESKEKVEQTKAFSWSDLLKKEDWLSVWIGFAIITIAAISVITGTFDFSALKFNTWGKETSLLDQLNVDLIYKLIRTFVVLLVLFAVGIKLQGGKLKDYLFAFVALFVLGIIVRLISAEYICNRYLEWAFWALAIGLIISNVFGTPKWIKPAVRTEYYIKTGLVIMGFSVLFSNIVNFGLYGLGIAWGVTPIVMIFMWWFGIKVLKIDNRPFVITMAAATSVCGTSAAIAVGAASKAKKTDLSMAVSISIIFTVIMMVFEPIMIKMLGMDELMGGALIGGTIDSTGAVTVAATVLGEKAQTIAILVKSIQNVLIGFIAFAVAVFFSSTEQNKKTADAREIWYRVPKFIIGFFVASLVASFVFIPVVGADTVNQINKVLDQYKNWAFVLAFLSIGLETDFREIKKQFAGGKPVALYVVGQLFNILLTYAVIYILLSGKIFPIPTIK